MGMGVSDQKIKVKGVCKMWGVYEMLCICDTFGECIYRTIKKSLYSVSFRKLQNKLKD